MLMFLAEAAKLEEMSWFIYNGKKAVTLGNPQQFNQRHTLTIKPNALIGLKQAVRGPGAGNYQVVLAEAPHVLFRNVPYDRIQKLSQKMEKHKGPKPVKAVPEGRKRAVRVTIKEKSTSDKLKDDLFKPTGTINERTVYDKENYQWRKVVSKTPIRIVTLKQGRSRSSISEGDIVGVRYMTKARGGFVILPNGLRVNISHDSYMEIVNNARILPARQQQKGIVLISEVKSVTGKLDRIRKPKEETEDELRTPLRLSRDKANAKLLRDAKKHAYHHVDDDFEDDEPSERQPDAEVTKKHAPVAHTPQSLEVGSVIRSGRVTKNLFIVANIEDKGAYNELSLYNPETQKVQQVRMNKDVDLTRIRDLMIMEKATPSERAAAIRAYTRAAKTRSFVTNTIHDNR